MYSKDNGYLKVHTHVIITQDNNRHCQHRKRSPLTPCTPSPHYSSLNILLMGSTPCFSLYFYHLSTQCTPKCYGLFFFFTFSFNFTKMESSNTYSFVTGKFHRYYTCVHMVHVIVYIFSSYLQSMPFYDETTIYL